MQDISTVLFDIDGTLLDTREFILQAAEHTFRTHGFAVPERGAIASMVGLPLADLYTTFTGLEDVLFLKKTHDRFQTDNIHLSKLFPGARETLQTLRDRGLKLAAVTSRSKASMLRTLKQAGIDGMFDAFVFAEDCPELKPHPGPLLKALSYLNVAPAQAVMVGDSHVDVEAGINAGTRAVRATYGFHTDRLHDPEPDFFISAIQALLSIELYYEHPPSTVK